MEAIMSILGGAGGSSLGTTTTAAGMPGIGGQSKAKDEAAAMMQSMMGEANKADPMPMRAVPRQVSLEELMQALKNRSNLGT